MKSDERKWNMYKKNSKEGSILIRRKYKVKQIRFLRSRRESVKNQSIYFERIWNVWVGSNQHRHRNFYSLFEHTSPHTFSRYFKKEDPITSGFTSFHIHHRCNHCAKRDKPSTSKGDPFTPTRLRVHPPRIQRWIVLINPIQLLNRV